MLKDPTESYAQRLLITALGDYEHLSPAPIPSASLVAMMEEFDISSDSTRSALSRLVKRDYLRRFHAGRTTGYRLSEVGQRLVEEAKQRISEFGLPRRWDGTWTIVAFSVAENLRHNRHVLRSHLRALGFAPFYDGLWIAAYADTQEVTRQLAEVPNVDVAVFRATLANQSEVAFTKLFDTWKLDEVRSEYEEFITAFGPLRARLMEDSVAPSEAFVARTRLMDAWRVFPRIDPDLPDEILPGDWPRSTARGLCSAIYDALKPTADLRFLSLIAS